MIKDMKIMKNMTERIRIQELQGTRTMKMKPASMQSQTQEYTHHTKSVKPEKRAVTKK